MVFLSGHKNDMSFPELEKKLRDELIGQEDLLLIEKFSAARKGTVVLHFLEQNTITAFKSKYVGKDFLGGKVRLS
jgi:hypothetical protein